MRKGEIFRASWVWCTTGRGSLPSYSVPNLCPQFYSTPTLLSSLLLSWIQSFPKETCPGQASDWEDGGDEIILPPPFAWLLVGSVVGASSRLSTKNQAWGPEGTQNTKPGCRKLLWGTHWQKFLPGEWITSYKALGYIQFYQTYSNSNARVLNRAPRLPTTGQAAHWVWELLHPMALKGKCYHQYSSLHF